MTNKEYNGWTNYETWLVNLWIDNEQWSQEQCRELAEVYAEDEECPYQLSRDIKSFVEDDEADCFGIRQTTEGKLASSMVSDLVSAALSEVDWQEIAEHFFEAAKEEAAYSAR